MLGLKEAILGRHSIRGYLDKPVDKKTLEDVLELACRSITSVNAQPWKFVVLSGDVIKEVGRENEEAFMNDAAIDFPDQILEGVYKERNKDLAKQLFAAADIAREDKEKRLWWILRGFRFFDAPAAILIFMDESIDEKYYRFDCGAVAQNICLAAEEYGLSTCVEDQAITYQAALRKRGLIPEGTKAVVGISIGYCDPDFEANRVITPRVAVSENTMWYGFDA